MNKLILVVLALVSAFVLLFCVLLTTTSLTEDHMSDYFPIVLFPDPVNESVGSNQTSNLTYGNYSLEFINYIKTLDVDLQRPIDPYVYVEGQTVVSPYKINSSELEKILKELGIDE